MKELGIFVALSFLPFSVLAQGANSQGQGTALFSQEAAQKLIDLGQTKQSEAKTRIGSMSADEVRTSLKDNLSNVTKIIYQEGYGVFVEYTATDGSDRMWFPNNQKAVVGVWGISDQWGGPRACFHYFNSYNYVTKAFESTECIDPEATLSGYNVIDQKPGDVFHLMSGQIPYRKTAMDVPVWP